MTISNAISSVQITGILEPGFSVHQAGKNYIGSFLLSSIQSGTTSNNTSYCVILHGENALYLQKNGYPGAHVIVCGEFVDCEIHYTRLGKKILTEFFASDIYFLDNKKEGGGSREVDFVRVPFSRQLTRHSEALV